MFIVVFGMLAAAILSTAFCGTPQPRPWPSAIGQLRSIDFSFNLTEKYVLVRDIGMFLMLSYFGCDQSRVQRYITPNRSTKRGSR